MSVIRRRRLPVRRHPSSAGERLELARRLLAKSDQKKSSVQGAEKLTGQVKTLRSERGFGFIAADDGKEYFFHQKGPRATNVQVATTAPEPAA